MVWGKIENNKFVEAPEDFKDETGFYPAFNQNIEAMTERGYEDFSDDLLWKTGNGMLLIVDNEIVENPDYIQSQKDAQLKAVTHEYIQNKDELLPIWTQSFINGLATATSMDDIKAKVTAFKNKSSALLTDYITKTEEINNG